MPVLIVRKLFNKSTALNLALSAASLLVVAPIGGELFFRIGIAAEIGGLRNPRLYAGMTDDEDCWKLRYRWRDTSRGGVWDGPLVFDPSLGWTMGEEAVGDCEDCPGPVLVYGDSFVFGVDPVPVDRRLPSQLGRLLPGRTVVNYAVNGYGLDQMYLRLRATHRRYEDPTLVVGIMMLDLDRSIFSVRAAPKPYFRLEGGELELEGVPVDPDIDAWHRRHPPQIRSFLYAFLKRWSQLSGVAKETEVKYRRDEKMRLNARILEALAGEAADHGRTLLIVLLYPPWDMDHEGWREPFLKEQLERLGVPYVDTKPLLLEHAGDPSKELFLPAPNNHLTAFSNRIVAREISQQLRRLWRRARREENRVE